MHRPDENMGTSINYVVEKSAISYCPLIRTMTYPTDFTSVCTTFYLNGSEVQSEKVSIKILFQIAYF